ncbi:MAG: NADH:flavin oxidoreductase [Flavobacteriales bacterium]|nr:NADH:flavin oxidoreductase [Flavobacteriales bacterium]MCB9192613.1 NADH:flavin oxidoreductase [Flavobacteriales bacterium]
MIKFPCGATMKNRFGLAPMTNCQSHEDGSLSDDEFNWLVKRAEGGFGLTMTCASHVQAIGKGFPSQLGIFSDELMDGHKRLAAAIKEHGSLAVIQLHHAGLRSPKELIGQTPVSPSANEKHGSRALSLEEVHQLRDDFIAAAVRSQKCGYDGIEVHGAHGYIICQFLSSQYNQRTDEYGGSLENRSRLLFEILDGIRRECGAEFLLGVRLSPERFGMDIQEIKDVCNRLIADSKTDFLDISLWDCFKDPEDEQYNDKSLLEHFTSLDYKNVKLTVAGKIRTGHEVQKILDAGVDFVSIGRSAILHHDFPKLVMENPDFEPVSNPVSREHLRKEGLGEKFIDYMSGWPEFVAD